MKKKAFSLVEMVLALGIFTFAIISLMGLIPVALDTHKNAKDEVVMAQVLQRLAGEVLLTDPSKIEELDGRTYAFSAEGVETESNRAIFRGKIKVSSMQMPGGSNSKSLKRMELFVAKDPGNTKIQTSSPSGSTLQIFEKD